MRWIRRYGAVRGIRGGSAIGESGPAGDNFLDQRYAGLRRPLFAHAIVQRTEDAPDRHAVTVREPPYGGGLFRREVVLLRPQASRKWRAAARRCSGSLPVSSRYASRARAPEREGAPRSDLAPSAQANAAPSVIPMIAEPIQSRTARIIGGKVRATVFFSRARVPTGVVTRFDAAARAPCASQASELHRALTKSHDHAGGHRSHRSRRPARARLVERD